MDSALFDAYNHVTKQWFKKSERPFIDHALRRMEKNWDKNIFVIEAPTGYGKSTISAAISLYSIKEELKSIVAFPLRSLLEDQYNKFRVLFGKELGKRYMHNPESRYLIKPVTLTTIDTLALTIFGIPPEDLDKVVKYWDGTSSGSLGHYLFSWASIALSNIVLDEVHLLADSTKSLNFLLALMHSAVDNDQKLVLMSATIPKALEDLLMLDECELIKFEAKHDMEFVKSRREKSYDVVVKALSEKEKFRAIKNWLEAESTKYSRVMVVFNTVRDAVRFYSMLGNEFGYHKLLIHSRFNELDRERIVEKLRDLKGAEKFIVVATQVIEAGVDISSNLFITELAPANSLIQRLGRFLRYENEREGKVFIWYEVDESGTLLNYDGKYKVYDWDLTSRTLEKLMEMENFSVHLPDSYQPLLDIYTADDFQISERDLNDLRRILMNFEYGPIKAVDKFFELEGSFVRDGLMVPAITPDLLESCRTKEGDVDINNVAKLSVPLSFEVVKAAGMQKVVLLRNDGGNEMPYVVDIDEVHSSRQSLYSPRSFLRWMIRNSVIAVVLDGKYDEMGLAMGD